MPSTRHSSSADPGHAPEGQLSNAAHRSINVSLAVASLACRIYDPATRAACLWLANLSANSQRIQLCWQDRLLPDPLGTVGRITEADLASRLGLTPFEIYAALSGHPEADLPKFRAAVQRLRAGIEGQLPPLVRTADSDIIATAFVTAADGHKIATLKGKWRHGKTEECQRLWLRNLHRAIWVHVPADATERTFLGAIAQALGINAGSGKKSPILREQLKRAFGIGLIDCICFDEAHNLWPTDVSESKPVRIEYVRELRDTLGVGSVLITTEQFALSMALAMKSNTRWAPGQFSGRRDQFTLSDIHTDVEILAIAKLHGGGELPAESLPVLVEFAKSEEGYLGAMTTAIRGARSVAKATGRAVTTEDVAAALKRQRTEERVTEAAEAARAPRRRRLAVLERRAA